MKNYDGCPLRLTFAWEQRRLCDENTEMLAGGDVDKSRLKEQGKYPVIANALTNDGIVGYYDTEYRVKAPAVTVTGRGDVGHAKARHVDFTPVVRLLSIKSPHDVHFLENAINTLRIVIESTGVPQLTVPQLSQYELRFPNEIGEEQKIGQFFRNLDTLITLHQRKYEQLVNIKKSMLEKMFPKNGELVPEVRFAGFTDAWEQRKIADECSISTGKSNTQDSVDDGKYPFFVRSPIVERSNRYLFDEEAVLTVGDGVGTGKVFHYVNGKYDLHQRVYRMFDFSENISAKYFYYFFSTHFYDRVMSMTAKTSVDSVRYEMIADMDIQYPNKKEQVAISNFFDNLDTLITLHQRKLELVKNRVKTAFWRTSLKNYDGCPLRLTFAWEQREFGEIVSEYVDPVSTPTKGYYRLGIKSHAKGTFHSYVRPGMELGTAQMHRVAANNFIVNITFGWEHAVAITTEDDAGKLVSHRFPQFSFSAGMVPAYFKYLILDEDFRHHLWLASPGGAGRNRVLKISEMLEYKFWVPSQEEQQKISILLTKLDALITLHQCKLERLQNIKKACLEKMFV